MEGAHYLISVIGSKKPFSGAENDKVDNMGNQNLASGRRGEGPQADRCHFIHRGGQ